MKIQGLAVIAMIIIVPISILLNSYSDAQIKTLHFQVSYDSRLLSATYDGIKAFQLNMANSSDSDMANSKIRDINAAIKTFYTSLATHFGMVGYDEDVLKEYVPAVVYTLYDGYYIYSAYTNELNVDAAGRTSDGTQFYDNSGNYDYLQQREWINGLKPYVYYSCRYRGCPQSDDDFIITYSLDSYIAIQGTVNGQPVDDAGYLLSSVDKNGSTYSYRGVNILDGEGPLSQYVYMPDWNNTAANDKVQSVPYVKINGAKYYKGPFSAKNGSEATFRLEGSAAVEQKNDRGVIANQLSTTIDNNNMGKKFYEQAYAFKERILNDYTLGNLSTDNAVQMNGEPYDAANPNPFSNVNIFRRA